MGGSVNYREYSVYGSRLTKFRPETALPIINLWVHLVLHQRYSEVINCKERMAASPDYVRLIDETKRTILEYAVQDWPVVKSSVRKSLMTPNYA